MTARIVALLALLLAARAFVHVNPARRPTPQVAFLPSASFL